MNLLNDSSILRLIQFAIHEDIGDGDVTSEATVSEDSTASARFLQKQDGVVCGMPILPLVFREFSPDVVLNVLRNDGDYVEAGTVIATVDGPARALLAAERTALNFIQRMSGVATLTQAYVDKMRGTKTQLLDTRKTIPGWRLVDKYSTQVGGAVNHRMGLFDMIMIKDNHITAAGGVKPAIERCLREIEGRVPIRVEVEAKNIQDVKDILDCAGVDRVMFDNFSPEEVARGVQLVGGAIETEASGGINYETIRSYAQAGVDYVSSGAITHSAKALDISMKLLLARGLQ